MSNVYTRIIGVPRTARNGRAYGVGGSFQSSFTASPPEAIPPTATATPTDVISFTNAQYPEIADYTIYWGAIHGQWPKVYLITIDEDGNRIERTERPKFIMTDKDGSMDDTIETVIFDLAEPATGFIILT